MQRPEPGEEAAASQHAPDAAAAATYPLQLAPAVDQAAPVLALLAPTAVAAPQTLTAQLHVAPSTLPATLHILLDGEELPAVHEEGGCPAAAAVAAVGLWLCGCWSVVVRL